MLDEIKWNQYGFKRVGDIQGITLHNTNNTELSARQLFNWLNTENKTSQGCHFLVDHEEIIEVMPLEWSTYHTGKAMDFGNKYTIAIEICSNLNDELYFKGEERAMKLVRELMNKYKLSNDDIYYHRDFNLTTHCPNDILNIYKSKQELLNKYKEV